MFPSVDVEDIVETPGDERRHPFVSFGDWKCVVALYERHTQCAGRVLTLASSNP